MSYLFPAVFMTNAQSMTVLLIILGLAGKSDMAADVGIVQGATLALFYALSANARNVILNINQPVHARSIMVARVLLLLPVGGMIFWLSTTLSGVETSLAVILILRRSVEWLGEVHLSEMERTDDRTFGLKYLLTQAVLFIVAVAWLLSNMEFSFVGLLMWAVLPICISLRFIGNAFSSPFATLKGDWKKTLPHIGSTTVIGITVYVFRLLILLLVGKTIAGDLFTAFALGGVLGSVYAGAFGPSVALHESRTGSRNNLPELIRLTFYVSLLLGAILFVASAWVPHFFSWSGKSVLFWNAVSLSMIGGVVMVSAQITRNRYLQTHTDADVFGPDVLMNVLLIATIPFFYHIFGLQSFAVLYLLSASLAFVLYRSCEKEKCPHPEKSPSLSVFYGKIIGILLVLPLFFQVSTGIFHDPKMIYDTGGILLRLPIPLSVFACFGGILILGNYGNAFKSLSFLFFTFILMIVSTAVSTHTQQVQQQAKYIFMLQFILPMFALFLGEAYESNEEKGYYLSAFLYTLAITVPLHLLSTWSKGFLYLHPHIYFFSIYQHLQYVPVILVSAYLISFYALWRFPRQKKILQIMVPLMAIYAAASLSMRAMLLLLAGLLVFAVYTWKLRLAKVPFVIFLLALIMCSGYVYFEKEASSEKFTFLKSSVVSKTTKHTEYFEGYSVEPNKTIVKSNIEERVDYWLYYAKRVLRNVEALLLGHTERPDRTLYPSAHNYYLDFIYNFGVLALLPMLVLLWYTIMTIYFFRHEIMHSPDLLGLAVVVIFLLFVDNALNVGLRQPYPGIFTFFIWGVLLRKLTVLKNGKGANAF